MKRVTLSDVALHAGVSKGTVSMVLNDNPRVAESTRIRVQASMLALGYIYDRTAASLRKAQTHAVGVIVTQLTNPYFAEFAEGIQGELDARGTDLLLGVSAEDVARQTRLLRSMTARRVDGIVLIPAHGTVAENVDAGPTPVLLLARRVPGLDVDYVGADNQSGAREATSHLINVHGSRRPVFVGGFVGSSARGERLAGFELAAEAAGIQIPALEPFACSPERAIARGVARRLLDQHAGLRPDAVVCFNDAVAFGVIDAASELGLTVGRDIRIVGFDDVHAAAASRPSLSSVGVQAQRAGAKAAERLLGRISGELHDTADIVLDVTFHGRDTCGCTSLRESA
jgi:LacI family transcriptional regulator, galactose operon repressor